VTNSLWLLPAVAGLVAWLSIPASAQSVDPSFYYKPSTQFRGNGMKLDVFNGGPKNNLTRLEPDQDVSGQFWRFRERRQPPKLRVFQCRYRHPANEGANELRTLFA
jgi:hypothetical protein